MHRAAKDDAPQVESKVQVDVPFHDLDPMQVVWHGNYLKYFELARQRLFDDRQIDLYAVAMDSGYLFPIVKTAVKYIKPLRFRDRIEVSARLRDAQRRILLDFEIVRLPEGEVCARATSEQVAIRGDDMALQFSIPEEIRLALGVS